MIENESIEKGILLDFVLWNHLDLGLICWSNFSLKDTLILKGHIYNQFESKPFIGIVKHSVELFETMITKDQTVAFVLQLKFHLVCRLLIIILVKKNRVGN